VHVMRAGAAYSLARDGESLARLRTRYAAKMAATPDAAAFAAVAEDIESQGVAFRDLVRNVGSVETLEAYLADLRARANAPAAIAATN